MKYNFLKTLAETLDISATMERLPELSSENIRSYLYELADAVKAKETVLIYVDGASRGNPGPAGVGIIITSENRQVLKKIGRYIGKTTNNMAEYYALNAAVKEALAIGAKAVRIFADSELMVRQVKGEYRVKSEALKPVYKDTMALLMQFDEYDIIHIDREKNADADRLANQAIDMEGDETHKAEVS